MEDSFNSDYYITVATVVPLLYITLFLQGKLMQDFSTKVGKVYGEALVSVMALVVDRWFRAKFELKDVKVFIKGLVLSYGSAALFAYVVFASVLAGPVAAGYAIWALFYRSDVFFMRMVTMVATIALLFLVISGPAIVVIRNNFLPMYEEAKKYVKTRADAEHPEDSSIPEA